MIKTFGRASAWTLLGLLTSLAGASDIAPAQERGELSISINGGPCTYATVQQALANAQAGDSLIIKPGNRVEFIGEIDIDVTLRQGQAGAPGNTGCETAVGTPDPANLVFDGQNLGDDADGGIAEVLSGRTVSFIGLTLRQASATRGGLLAIQPGSSVSLSRSSLENGNASESGGLIHAVGTAAQPINLTVYQSDLVGGITTGSGGAIHGAHVDLSLTLVSFIDNAAGDSGGAIHTIDGMLLIDTSDFEDNFSESEGGAIRAEALDSLHIMDSNFLDNGATFNGGALSIDTANELRIEDDSRFIGNAADGLGGAIHLLTADTGNGSLIQQTLFQNNIGAFGGGALWIDQGPIEIGIQSNFVSNRANEGGAVMIDAAGPGSVRIHGASFTSNEAFMIGPNGGNGGALLIRDPEDALLENLVFDLNQAGNFGGGLYVNGADSAETSSLTLRNAALTANTATRMGGGAFLFELDTLSLNELLIQNNTAIEEGGGARLFNIDDALLDASLIDGNESNYGGGLRLLGGHTRIEGNSMLINNSATPGSALGLGGGMAQAGGQVTITGARVEGNDAKRGGGIYQSTGLLRIINSQISGNIGTERGGGIASTFGELEILAEISKEPGHCQPETLPSNRYCMEISNNLAGQDGGAIALGFGSSSTPRTRSLRGVALFGNEAGSGGSAIFASPDAGDTSNFENLLITNHGGGALSVLEFEGNQAVRIDSSTIADNNGSPLVVNDNATSLTLMNSILYANGTGPNVAFGVPFTRSCNNSQPGQGQSMGGNLGDPGFVTTARGNYRLGPASASADQCAEGPGRDLDGFYRLSGSPWDQGAFEHDGLLSPPDPLFSDRFSAMPR